MNNGFDKSYVTKRFWIRCICLLLVFIAGGVFSWIILEPFWLNIAKDKIIFDVQNLNNQEVIFLNSLISANKLHTAEFAFDKIISFYETLITIIITISAAFGIIGYLYIKNSHQRDIEEGIYSFCNSKYGESILKAHAQNNAKEYFSQAFKESLNDGEIKVLSINVAQNSDDINKLSKDLDEVIKRLTEVEEVLEQSETITYEELSISENTETEPNVNKNDIEENLIEKTLREDVAVEIDTANTDNIHNNGIDESEKEIVTAENEEEGDCGDNTK